MANTHEPRLIHLSDAEAAALKTALAPSLFVDPVTYERCREIGIWRRLDAGDQYVPRGVEQTTPEPHTTPTQTQATEAAVERILLEHEIEHLLVGTGRVQMAALLGGAAGSSDDLLAVSGLELAVLMGGRRFVGSKLVKLISRLSRLESALHA